MMYCAMIGDIIESRKIENRQKAQQNLKQILDEINIKYSSKIVSKFTITIGDEFQGLLKSPEELLDIVDEIKLKFYPNRIRFGIGFGELHTEIFAEAAIGSDGPAYYAAREAIDNIKKSNNKYEQPDQDILILANKNKDKFGLLNVTLSMCTYIEKGWSDKQREAISCLFFEKISQRDLAEKLGLEQSSVQRRLTKSGYFTYRNGKNQVQKKLVEIWEELNV